MFTPVELTIKKAKRIVIAIIGFTVLAIGIAMIALPGPAIIVILIGLSILASEFIWAQRLLQKVRERILKMNNINKTDKR